MRDYVIHHGVIGMHWGVRRYQNPDGSLTAAGRSRLRDISGEWDDSSYYSVKGKKGRFKVRNGQNKETHYSKKLRKEGKKLIGTTESKRLSKYSSARDKATSRIGTGKTKSQETKYRNEARKAQNRYSSEVRKSAQKIIRDVGGMKMPGKHGTKYYQGEDFVRSILYQKDKSKYFD